MHHRLACHSVLVARGYPPGGVVIVSREKESVMVTWSQFTEYAAASRKHVPPAQWEAIRKEAVARLRERFAAGYARTPLDFSDLVEKMESAISRA